MLLRVPDGFTPDVHARWVQPLGSFRSQRVYGRAIGGVIAVEGEMGSQVVWGFGLSGSDDESQSSLVDGFQVLR
nr:hypothetical protein GCM10023233_18310 [Brevibacterium otitidis]